MKKSILSLALAVIMVMALLTIGAFADGEIVEIDSNEDLVNAITNQATNQTWVFTKAGTYDAKNTTAGSNGTYLFSDTYAYPFAFPIVVDNLTIKKADDVTGDVTITSSYEATTANWHDQNFITVYGSGLTIDGVKILANKNTSIKSGEVKWYDDLCNKAIEFTANAGNFTLKDMELKALENSNGQRNSGSIWVGCSNVGNSLIENVKMASFISGSDSATGTLTITNLEQEYTDFNRANVNEDGYYLYGVKPTIAGDLNVNGLTMYVDSTSNIAEQAFSDRVYDGTTIVLAPGTYNVTADECIIIDKKLTIKGAGESTVIKGSGTTDYGLGFFTFNAGSEGSVIEDLTINYNATGAQRSAIYFNYGFGGDADNVTQIKNVNFKGADSLENIKDEKAIAIGSTYIDGGYIEISGCTIENFAYGMYFNAVHDLTITGNTINGTKYNGINIAGDGAIACENIIIASNKLTNIAAANYDSDLYSSGISVGQNSSDINIESNDISMLNGKPGIFFAPKGDGTSNGYIVTILSGNTVVDQIAVSSDNNTITLPNVTNSGYIFLGWRDNNNVTHKAGEVVTITADTTFTAVWGNLPDVKPSEPETPETPVFPFYDVTARDWYYSAVKYVYEKGLMDGVDVGVFAPNDTLTRAMVWTIIARAEGVDTTGGATWYAKAQEWVTAKGISDGENPSAAITRQELVTMLYRLAGEPAVSGTITAPDASSVSTWATDAMTWAMNIGLVEGDENGAVTPTATATRAQAAALIMRYLEA